MKGFNPDKAFEEYIKEGLSEQEATEHINDIIEIISREAYNNESIRLLKAWTIRTLKEK